MPGLDEEIESTVASMTEDLARKNAMVWALLSDEIQEKVKEDITEATPKKTANEYAREYINERGMQFVTQMTDTDKAQLREIFLDNWGSPKKIAQEIDESYNVSKDRLARIYRTEMGMAKKTGKFLDAQDANMEVRDWTPIGDERTCEVCMELAAQNQGVPMDEPYTTGEMVAVGHPGGCRCIDTFRKLRDPPALTEEDFNEELEDLEEPEDVKKYGTSEGAIAGWDTRGRGRKEEEEKTGKTIDELSPIEQDAIADYTRGLSYQISSLIIEGKLDEYEDPTNASPDESPTKSTWTLIHTLDGAIEASEPLEPGEYFHGIDDESKYVEGKELDYKTFMSVTDDIETARKFGYQENDDYQYHVLRVRIQDGQKGIAVSSDYTGSDFPDMTESILPRDIKLMVGKSSIEGNTKITDVTIIPSKNIKKYGTSEGALLGWDHRGRGHKVTDEPKKERKIASPLTKIQLEELEHDYVSTNYKDTTNRGNIDIYLNKIAEIQGFTETPQLVSDSELRQYSNDNKVKILYKGISSHEHTKEFKYGAYQARTGLSGDGIYVAYGKAGEEVAISYARAVPWTQGGGSSLQPLEKGDVIKMCLDKDAKIINVDDAYKLRKEIVDKHDLESTHILNDEGRLAAIMGYDAIDIPNDEFMIVLNRTKLRVVK